MPTDSTSTAVVESYYRRLKEDAVSFREKGHVLCCLLIFNACVGRSDDVIGMFEEW